MINLKRFTCKDLTMSEGNGVLTQQHCNNCILFQNKSPQVKLGMSLCKGYPGKTSKQNTFCI